jgi:hypothetical protein
VTALHVFQKGQMTFALVGIVYAAIEMHTTWEGGPRTFHCPTCSCRIPGSPGSIPGFLVHWCIPGAFLVHSWYIPDAFLGLYKESWYIPGAFLVARCTVTFQLIQLLWWWCLQHVHYVPKDSHMHC